MLPYFTNIQTGYFSQKNTRTQWKHMLPKFHPVVSEKVDDVISHACFENIFVIRLQFA